MGENTNIDKQKLINAILNASGSKINKNTAEKAAKGDINALKAGLNGGDRRVLNEALADPQKARALLSSDEARALLKKLSGGK